MPTPPPLREPAPEHPAEPFPVLTARTRVRRLRADDLPGFQAIRQDPEVGRWQGWTPVDDATAAAFLAAMSSGPWHRPGEWTQMALADRETDALFGDIGLHWPARAGAPLEIGFSLARSAQGRGLAHESVGAALQAIFRTGVAPACVAITDTRNTASVRLLERLGFARIATEPATFREEPCEEHHYLLTGENAGGGPSPNQSPNQSPKQP